MPNPRITIKIFFFFSFFFYKILYIHKECCVLPCSLLFSSGLTLIGLYQAGAMEDIGCSPVQLLVFSSLIVAVDPVAVSILLLIRYLCFYFFVFSARKF